MKKLNNIENELDSIRVALYEKTKDMSASERIAYIKAQTTPVHEQYGIQTIKDVKLTEKRRASQG